jgi:hypothetical protein
MISTTELSKIILEITSEIIIKIELSLNKSLNNHIKDDFIKKLEINLCKGYFNDIYKSLILNSNYNNDIINKIKKINNNLDHNYICLLNILFDLTTNTIQQINRTKYDFTSSEKLIESINDQLKLVNLIEIENIKKLLFHECTNIEIEKCNPFKQLFK